MSHRCGSKSKDYSRENCAQKLQIDARYNWSRNFFPRSRRVIKAFLLEREKFQRASGGKGGIALVLKLSSGKVGCSPSPYYGQAVASPV